MKKYILLGCLSAVVVTVVILVLTTFAFPVRWSVDSAENYNVYDGLIDWYIFEWKAEEEEAQYFFKNATGFPADGAKSSDYRQIILSFRLDSRIPGLMDRFFFLHSPCVMLYDREAVPDRLVYCNIGTNFGGQFSDSLDMCRMTMLFYVGGMSKEEAEEYMRNGISEMDFLLMYEQEGVGSREKKLEFSLDDLPDFTEKYRY